MFSLSLENILIPALLLPETKRLSQTVGERVIRRLLELQRGKREIQSSLGFHCQGRPVSADQLAQAHKTTEKLRTNGDTKT